MLIKTLETREAFNAVNKKDQLKIVSKEDMHSLLLTLFNVKSKPKFYKFENLLFIDTDFEVDVTLLQ